VGCCTHYTGVCWAFRVQFTIHSPFQTLCGARHKASAHSHYLEKLERNQKTHIIWQTGRCFEGGLGALWWLFATTSTGVLLGSGPITYTAHPDPLWTAMGPDIRHLMKVGPNLRNTGPCKGQMSCSRDGWRALVVVLPHSTGYVGGQRPSHTQHSQDHLWTSHGSPLPHFAFS
jgi:hypothetical protein